jgi:hypothetical protein
MNAIIFISNTILLKLVNEKGLVRSQSLIRVKFRNPLISYEVDEVKLFFQFRYRFIMNLTARGATLTAITIIFTTFTDNGAA